MNTTDWPTRAACSSSDTDLWFAPVNHPDRRRRALQICGNCPVRVDCLNHALATGEPHGIWGGMTAGQRDQLRRQAA